ncbi:hypothetical protein A2U01_0102800, partial [Trifolium medium]|nr:hypothetical protein [Trifolium medium]
KLTINPDHSRCTVGEKGGIDTTSVQQRSKFGVKNHLQHHPHQIPQYGQYSEYDLGMTAYNYNTAVMTD